MRCIMAKYANLYTCVCGLGFGSCYPRKDTVVELDIAANTERGAKMKARKKYAEMVGQSRVDNCGFTFKVTEVSAI